jgi:hypothetical protein
MSTHSSLRKIEPRELAAETNLFTTYLQQIGLPTDNVIATTSERNVVVANLPAFLETLSPEEKRNARYLSKFVGATAIGLFDAALNYVWNEVVLNLRRKVVIYGLELFYDAAVGGKNRDLYKDESDLGGLKDSVLLDTCLKLELISDVVYRKLDHILTMRNEVAASHPNVESIGGFELLGWMQTCVKNVLQDRPSDSAIRISSFVNNVRAAKSVVDNNTAARFREELRNLSTPHVHNLLITFFGMYVAPGTEQVQRKNIALLLPAIWEHSEERAKYRVGEMIDGYRTNLESEKLKHGIELLGLVDGKSYESLPARLVAISGLCAQLLEAHTGYNNFYNEPPVMREIQSYCKKSTDIPEPVLPTLVHVVLRCRIGRGLSYHDGVSPAGCPMYDHFLELLTDDGVIQCLLALMTPDLSSKLQNAICQQHLVNVLNMLKKITISDRVKQAIDHLLSHPERAHKVRYEKAFQEITSPFIQMR